jgi:pimeloyl-ACP methyl ester carboxylesterase
VRAVLRNAYFEKPVTEDLVTGYAQPWRDRSRRPWLCEVCRRFFSTEYERMAQSWERLEAELLVLWGQRDTWIPLRDGALLTARVPGARLVTFARAGHCPQQEVPRDFDRAVLEHLARSPSLLRRRESARSRQSGC